MNIRKKLLLSFVSVIFISFLANAQDVPAPPADGGGGSGFMAKLNYGAKIGMGTSHFSAEQFRVGGQVGGQIGGFVSYKIVDMVSVQLEALYMQQGGRKHEMVAGSSVTGLVATEESISRITLHNIEIPLLARVKPPVIGDVFGIKWHALIGPSIGFNLGSTERTTTQITYTDGNTTVFKGKVSHGGNNDYNAMQWGGYIGAGIETELKSFLLTIDVRYRQGLNTVDYNYDITKFIHGYGDNKSNTFAVTIGVGLKK